jgi:hypothetical protein
MMEMWTIYDHPRDYPHCFVARRFLVYAGASKPTDEIVTAPDLEMVRRWCRFRGLACIPRDPNDDPKIVETWL